MKSYKKQFAFSAVLALLITACSQVDAPKPISVETSKADATSEIINDSGMTPPPSSQAGGTSQAAPSSQAPSSQQQSSAPQQSSSTPESSSSNPWGSWSWGGGGGQSSSWNWGGQSSSAAPSVQPGIDKEAVIQIANYGTVKYEAEDFNTKDWVSDDSYNGGVIITPQSSGWGWGQQQTASASGGKYLAAAKVGSTSTATFQFTLAKYSRVQFAAAYAQIQGQTNVAVDMSKVYFYNIESVSPFTLSDSAKTLATRNSATTWDLMQYESQNLYPGTYSVTLTIKAEATQTASIDYVQFVTSDPTEPEPVDPSTITSVPDNDHHNLQQYRYIMEPDQTKFKTYANGQDLSAPGSVKLRFDDVADASKYYVQVSKTNDFTGAKTYETTAKVYELKNSLLDTTYYYKAATSEAGLAGAAVKSLKTSANAPRVIDCPKVVNFRDIGGWETSLVPGAKINQGLYYRCAQLNQAGTSSTTSQINADGQKVIEELGIKVDIDMRDQANIPSASPANTSTWTLKLVNASIASGTESTRWEAFGDVYKLIFETIANCDKEPALLHCTYGADRTGIATVFLEGLLGMSKEDMYRDYVWTKFTQGRDPNPDGEFSKWMQKTEEQYTGTDFADKMEQHLMTKGISKATLEHIREIFIPGYVAKA